MKQCLKVAVIDDDADMRCILRRVLIENGFASSGSFASANEAMQSFRENSPDVIVLDIRLRGIDGITSIPILKVLCPVAKVIMFSALNAGSILREAFLAGADGYLLKPLVPSDVVSAVHAVSQNGTPLSPFIAHHLLEWGLRSQSSGGPALGLLTEREAEVMTHVAQARVDKEIAQVLNLSVLTVKRHLHNIYAKLGVSNRVGAINRLASAKHRSS